MSGESKKPFGADRKIQLLSLAKIVSHKLMDDEFWHSTRNNVSSSRFLSTFEFGR